MNEKMDGEFKDLSGLAERLGRADFSRESLVKDSLKERVLERAEKRRGRSLFIWLLPAAAALAAMLIMFNARRVPQPGPERAPSYELPFDGFGECGRQGLGDYMAGGRY